MAVCDKGAHVARLSGIAGEITQRFGDTITPVLVVAASAAPPDVPPTLRVLLDPELALHRRYAAATESLYLIRPDGYVGFRSQPAEASHLRAHLERYLIPLGSTS